MKPVFDSIAAALRLLAFDARSLSGLDASIAGFWRSFLALPLAVPIAIFQREAVVKALASLPEGSALAVPIGEVGLLPELIAFALSWLAFPVAMIFLARMLDVGRHYVLYIVGYNWLSLVLAGLGAVPAGLFVLDLSGGSAMFSATAMVGLLTIVYMWFLARTALGVGIFTALGLVILDYLLALLVAFLVATLS